jgi:hypothetical protein
VAISRERVELEPLAEDRPLPGAKVSSEAGDVLVRYRAGMMRSATSLSSASARLQPKVSSAWRFHSTTPPCSSIPTIASSDASSTARACAAAR